MSALALTRRSALIGAATTVSALTLGSSIAAAPRSYAAEASRTRNQVIRGKDVSYINPFQWVRSAGASRGFFPVAIKGSADQLVTTDYTATVPSSGDVQARAIARRTADSSDFYAAVATVQSSGTILLSIERVMNERPTYLTGQSLSGIGGAGTKVHFELSIRVRSNVVEGALLVDGRPLLVVTQEETAVPMSATPAGVGTGAAGFIGSSTVGGSLVMNSQRAEEFGSFRGAKTVAGWGKLIFEDDFDDVRYQGTANVDPTKWNIRHRDWSNHDIGVNDRNNVRVADSALELWTTHYPAGQEVTGTRMGTREWGTAYIDSIGKFSAKFFRAEIRMRTPNSHPDQKGAWGGLWFRPDNTRFGGEIDVAENFGYPTGTQRFDQTNIAESTFHYDQTGHNKYNRWQPKLGQQSSDEYHIWVVERTATDLVYSFDGVEIARIPNDDKFKAALPDSEPVNIRLNTQAGNSFWGFPADATADHVLKVDYLRIWAK